MEIQLNEEQYMVRSMLQDFAKSVLAPIAVDMDRTGEMRSTVLNKLKELGLMGIIIPEEYGGEGGSFLSYIIAVEELSRACASTGVTL